MYFMTQDPLIEIHTQMSIGVRRRGFLGFHANDEPLIEGVSHGRRGSLLGEHTRHCSLEDPLGSFCRSGRFLC